MKKTAYLGLCVLLFGAFAASAFAQQINDPKEYDFYYNKVYMEKDPAKQAAAGEKFLVDYKDTTARTQTYMMILLGHHNSQNWPKALETADKQATMAPTLDAANKKTVLLVGMNAADQTKNGAKLKSYAEEVLKVEPKHLGALISLSNLYANAAIPTDDAAKAKHFDDTLTIIRRTLAEPRPAAGFTDPQWNAIVVPLRNTECLVLLNQKKNSESIEACRAALKIDKMDGYAYYLIGLNLTPGYNEASKKYTDAVDNFNKNRDKGPIVTDDLKAEIEGASKAQDTKKDELIDVLAKAVACGGQGTAALKPLQQIFMGTPAELDALIKAKKAEL